jgi:hypothetical protein
MSWFRRKPQPAAIDRLRGPWACIECGEIHDGLVHLAAFAPDPWPGGEVREDNAALSLDCDFLSEDFCVMDGKYFFVRAVLEIPIIGMAEKFGFGCWSTLSRENFEKYLDGFDDGRFADLGPWSGWLCNQLADYLGTQPEAVWVHPQLSRQRPTLSVMNVDHSLAVDQVYGITPERVFQIFARYGHTPWS